MPPSAPAGGQPFALLIGVMVAAVIIILRNSRPRKLKIERLWLFPITYLVMLGAFFYGQPPPITPLSVAVMIAALAAGCGLGWQRGRLMRIDINPETHEMTSQASIVGVAFIMVVMVARMGLRSLLQGNAGFLHVPTAVIADGLVLLAVGMLATQRLEVWLRARKLLAEAQAAKARAVEARVESRPPSGPDAVDRA